MIKIGWFSSGRGDGSRGLLRFIQSRIENGELEANIEFVFSNRVRGESPGSDQFFDMVSQMGLPLFTLSSKEHRNKYSGSTEFSRQSYDEEVVRLLGDNTPDICVLAGYMLILSGFMCDKFPFLNLHPALPDGPVGTWQEVIWDLIANKATSTGAMMHLATTDVDRGPLVSYCTTSIVGPEFSNAWSEVEHGDLRDIRAIVGEELALFRQIREAEYLLEPYLIYETLRALGRRQIIISDGCVTNEFNLTVPLCLDNAITESLDVPID